MDIRAASSTDRAGIRAVVAAAFGQPGEADLVDRLIADGDAVIELVAVDADNVVGHVLFSRLAAPFRALALAPVSVRPDRQGEGIGGTLIRTGLAQASAAGWQGVFVLGDPSYYARFGFDPGLAAGFASPYAGPHLMALALNGPLPAATGRIAYAGAFAEL